MQATQLHLPYLRLPKRKGIFLRTCSKCFEQKPDYVVIDDVCMYCLSRVKLSPHPSYHVRIDASGNE